MKTKQEVIMGESARLIQNNSFSGTNPDLEKLLQESTEAFAKKSPHARASTYAVQAISYALGSTIHHDANDASKEAVRTSINKVITVLEGGYIYDHPDSLMRGQILQLIDDDKVVLLGLLHKMLDTI